MNRSYLAPIRSRADGSIYSEREAPLKALLGKTVLIFLLSLFVATVVMFEFVDPLQVAGKSERSTAAAAISVAH
jgi:hypothetical protein